MAGRKTIDAPNEYLGREETLSIDSIGTGVKDNEVIDKVVAGDNIAFEAFMHEPVTIMIHESTDENDVDLVQVWVNGAPVFLSARTAASLSKVMSLSD